MQDIEELGSLVVQVGGRPVEGGWDRLARYRGLRWSGGGDETRAFRYYDAVPSPCPDIVRPLDVLAAGALHPSLTKPDLTYLHEEANEITAWLDALPEEVPDSFRTRIERTGQRLAAEQGSTSDRW